MELSHAALRLLSHPILRPSRQSVVLLPSLVASILDCDETEATETLLELETRGFIEKRESEGQHGFGGTSDGARRSEALLRERRLRREPLVNQLSYRLKDLLIALAYEEHANNRRTPPGALGSVPLLPVADAFAFLGEWKSEAIEEVCSELVNSGLVSDATSRVVGGRGKYLELTTQGLKYYEKSVRPALRLSEDESILDPPARTLQLFFAWQSENKMSQAILDEVLPEVLEAVNQGLRLMRPLELVQAVQAGDGALRIDSTLQQRISDADYFVGDLTPVFAYKNRLRVNENVLVEAAFALASKPGVRIVLVALKDAVVDTDGSPNPQPTFDIRNVRRLEFVDRADLSKQLNAELCAMLRRDKWVIT